LPIRHCRCLAHRPVQSCRLMGELDETCRPRRWRYRRNYSGLSPGPGHSPFARPPKSHPQTWRSNSAGSILHLLGQIDFFKRILTVGKSKTEGGTGREIPLNPPAYAALLKWAGRFPSPNRRIMLSRPAKERASRGLTRQGRESTHHAPSSLGARHGGPH